MSTPGPFDVVESVTATKQRLISQDNAKDYKPFIVNRALSNNADVLFFAQDMNEMGHLDPLLQHEYFFYGLRKKKRWGRWNKKPSDHVIELCAYLKCTRSECLDMLKVTPTEEIDKILENMERAKN